MPIYLKTVYSFLTSLITIDDLINFAKKNKLTSLCICDDNMYGVMEFITKCNSNSINPIIGLDLSLCLLFAKNYSGYQNLMKLSSLKSEKGINLDDLKEFSSDVVCFIKDDSSNLDDLKKIFSDYYVYSFDNHDFPLRKTLCLEKEDLETLKCLHLLRDNKTISDEYFFDNDVYYQKINDSRYDEFINKCHVVLPQYELNLPDYCRFNDTKGLNSDEYLYNLSIAGLNKRFNNKVTKIYQERLLYELDVIKKMGFSNYFLIVYDYIKYAKSNDILVGPGRGSAAGSLVSYSLGITDVDPIKYDLLFERFLNIERVTMPDIDTDFPDEKRDEVINYVTSKYGKKCVSQISTFGTFGSKMALRDMGRVLNIPSYVIDDLCRKIGNSPLDEIKNPEIIKVINSDNKLKKLFMIAKKIYGIPRHSSIHAAGVVMANDSLENRVPLVLDNGKYLSAYESIYLENLGLLKMDFLGIKNLTIIDNTLKMILKYQKKNLKFSEIPLDDMKTNTLFQNGDTLGIFQFESKGMQDFLIKLHPENFEDIYNANAFYRPGPSNSISSFIRRRHSEEKIEYYFDDLKNILMGTKGIIVYQEQIMLIAQKLASFSLGEADILRRAMSKKKLHDIEIFKDKFVLQAIKNGYEKEKVLKIFDLILDFASYGFNKSHSVAYSMISYKMAYLKAHYPLYFYVALLSSSSMDEEKTKEYLKEMKKHHIKISKPDINHSLNNYSIYYDTLFLPFSIIKGISSVIGNKIVEIKEDGYKDVYDFFIKMVKGAIPRNIIELLIISGTLDSFNYNRKTLMENLDSLINYGNLCQDLGKDNVLLPEINVCDEYLKEELISNEKKCFGFYLSNHPVDFYKEKMDSIDLVDIKKYYNKNITCVLMIDRIKEFVTKNDQKMAFLSCSDAEMSIDVIVFPNVYESITNLKKNDIIKILGRVERKKDFNIIANEIVNIKEIV